MKFKDINESNYNPRLDGETNKVIMAIEESILKRMKKMFYDVKTEVDISFLQNEFWVRFSVNDSYEAKAYGNGAAWKKWLQKDLGIDPSLITASRYKNSGRYGDGFDYAIDIKQGDWINNI